MAITSEQVSVADTATALNTESGRVSGMRILITNRDTESAWIGASDVTEATGYELGDGESARIQITHGERLFAISSATGTTLHVLRTGG